MTSLYCVFVSLYACYRGRLMAGCAGGASSASPVARPQPSSRGSSTPTDKGDRNTKQTSDGVGQVREIMQQAQAGLADRGEKLGRLGEKAQELNNAASEFEKMAAMLAKQYK